MGANGPDKRLRPEGTHYDPDTFRRGIPQRLVEFADLSDPERLFRPNRLQEPRVESSRMNCLADGVLGIVFIFIALN